MIRPQRQTAVPHTIEVRWEILKAINALAVQDQASQFLGRSLSKFDSNEPRVPAGHPKGGQWTGTNIHENGVSDNAVTIVAARSARNQAECDLQLK